MKTKVEIEGYEIEIEFEGGVISVKAEFEDETIEEFTIEVEEGAAQGQSEFEDDDEIQGFDEFGQDEEEDFEGEEFEGDEDFEGEEFEGEEFEGEEGFEEDEEAPALESFQSFINKRRRK